MRVAFEDDPNWQWAHRYVETKALHDHDYGVTIALEINAFVQANNPKVPVHFHSRFQALVIRVPGQLQIANDNGPNRYLAGSP